ncbi:MAG: chemotaxis protein CheW [Gammaproteobacteria bacterium]|nr:chemotaxis protein CheW [Gammaproteobacteria bacterium]
MPPERQRKTRAIAPKPVLDRPAQAINEFLESLLEPVQEYHPPQEVREAIALAQLETQPKTQVTAQVTTEVASQLENPPATAIETQTASLISAQQSLPDYAAEAFQCLLFRASGNDFAIPLISLHSIFKRSQKPAKLPGQPHWHRGVLVHRENKIGLVDLGALLGEQADASAAELVIVLEDGRFGLICSEIFRPLRLTPDQVKWRHQRQERPWMLGALKEQLCPLIDTQALLAMLA